MKKIDITNFNVNSYQKLLRIKEGKSVPNNKCVYIPSLLVGIESFVVFCFLLVNPIFSAYVPVSLSYIIQLVLFLGLFLSIVKANVALSKKMGLHYFKKEHPEIDTDVDISQLKRELRIYTYGDNPKQNVRSNETHVNNQSLTSKQKLSMLRSEKKFWTDYKNDSNKKKDKDKVKKKKR